MATSGLSLRAVGSHSPCNTSDPIFCCKPSKPHAENWQAPDDSDGQEVKESTTASKWALTFFWKYLERGLGKNKSEEVRVVL